MLRFSGKFVNRVLSNTIITCNKCKKSPYNAANQTKFMFYGVPSCCVYKNGDNF